MRTIHRYSVYPTIPDRLRGLWELAYNLRWTWDSDTLDLFTRLDMDLWRWSKHNPVLLLGLLPQERLARAAEDEGLLALYDQVYEALQTYLNEPGWFRKRYPEAASLRVAYFSMEFGLTECLPIYSGGLGVLAGDHLKTASEFDLPLTGVGLMYKEGYFSQYLNPDGWQLEEYPLNDFSRLPVQQVMNADQTPLLLQMDLAGNAVAIQVWRAQVGRLPLYLLDTCVAGNSPLDRDITSALYGGGTEDRLRQEMVLGIGGMMVLRALGIEPQVCHMNEGHSAFQSLERIRGLMGRAGMTYSEARQVASAGTLFTTHTPVPAGFDLFSEDLMKKYFSAYVKQLGLGWTEFMAKGRMNGEAQSQPFNVAALAIRHAPRRNAVSRLHRRVTRAMMRPSWPDLPESEVPVEFVTNGVYVRGWVAAEMAVLLDRYLGPRWREDPADAAVWSRVDRIPDEELWRTHERQREQLVSYVRAQLEQQLDRRKASQTERRAMRGALNPEYLTIGFSRRFATYKRANLLLSDPPRLKAILTDPQRPVQVIFAGKAHPRDDAGKEIIRQIIHFARQEGLQDRMVFLEDYDLQRARFLVRGCDVWLNTPRRPLEASGTSGMKVLVNGGLNLSVLDGWWAEGFREGVGWAIGAGEEFADVDLQDRMDSQALYSLLEQEVVPMFYDRGYNGHPPKWLEMMKNSMKTLVPLFSAARMVKEYLERFYFPAAAHYDRMWADGGARAREVAAWKGRVVAGWPAVTVAKVTHPAGMEFVVGAFVPLEARVRLGVLAPADVRVEAFFGLMGADENLAEGECVPLEWVSAEGDVQVYRGSVPCSTSGKHGYAVRVLPQHEDVLIPNEMALIAWE
jgi:glycogen phosphorylase